MDVNSISNNISTLNNSTSLQLEKSSSSNKINNNEKDFLNLNINDYNKKRDELSANVQSLNEGIATSVIAKNSISKQQEYLSNIQDKLENINNYEDKNDIKQSINEDLRSFNKIAYETKFKKESLLVLEYADDKATIDINTKDSNFSIEKPNTASYANKIFETLNSSNLNNPEALDNVSNTIASSAKQLKNTYEDFTEFGNKLEVSARETIKNQIDLYSNNMYSKDKNFGRESSDFSKTNINSNLGYLAASQANIVQAQSVRLLS